ncbi:ATP-dependent RNA helicase DHX8-like [Coccinella septempunctata]|uniref:ATP-dependent RNA helicase DHX8-like n=1 Tax=Coccinella septempunctata TaxID=41139 RepID=UPI001D072358|nr:ATP-dependent RNA helicase DHX8-like [Coccinella septempunctata]
MNRQETMDELEKLEYLSLVSKVCTELENHLGLNDKDVAEFIIHLSEEHETFPAFKKALTEIEAEFSDSLLKNLLRIIQHMRPKKKKSSLGPPDSLEKEELAEKFPGLALPNSDPIGTDVLEVGENESKEDENVVAHLMAFFEEDAPSNKIDKNGDTKGSTDKMECKSHSKLRDSKRKRSRSSNRRSRSKEKKRRSRSKEKKRRSRSRDKRSRSRGRRSRSKGERSRSRGRRSRLLFLQVERVDRDRNPDRPLNNSTSVLRLPVGIDEGEEDSRKRVTRISSPEPGQEFFPILYS